MLKHEDYETVASNACNVCTRARAKPCLSVADTADKA